MRRLTYAADVEVLAEAQVGQYRVQVFDMRGFGTKTETVYRVLMEESPGVWRKVPCWTRADERRFPQRAAEVGSRMVETIKAERAVRRV